MKLFIPELGTKLNCGDNRGRDGEYLSDSIEKAIDLAENLDYIDPDR